MDASTPFLSLTNPALWAGISVALAMYLLATQSRRFLRPKVATVGGAASDPTADGLSDWAPSLEDSDRRRNFRRDGNPIRILIVGLDEDNPVDGRILDRSRTGLRIEVPRPAPAGATLLVRATRAAAGALWVPVTVRWCREGRGRSELGCQFTEEPEAATLALFG